MRLCIRFNCNCVHFFLLFLLLFLLLLLLLWFTKNRRIFVSIEYILIHSFGGVFYLSIFFSRLYDLFNKRLLKMCVCLHTRHISISPRFNQCRNPSIESRICTLILLLTMATATVLSFFVHIFAFLFLLWACVCILSLWLFVVLSNNVVEFIKLT